MKPEHEKIGSQLLIPETIASSSDPSTLCVQFQFHASGRLAGSRKTLLSTIYSVPDQCLCQNGRHRRNKAVETVEGSHFVTACNSSHAAEASEARPRGRARPDSGEASYATMILLNMI